MWNPPPETNRGGNQLFGYSTLCNILIFDIFFISKIFIYPIIHSTKWLTCLALLCNPPPMVNMGGQSHTWGSTPPIRFQCTPLHLVCGPRSRVIQYNSVNKEDMWKGIVNWVNSKWWNPKKGIFPLTLLDEILHNSAHNTIFRGWYAVNQPHLPNHTWFWVINMSSIAV